MTIFLTAFSNISKADNEILSAIQVSSDMISIRVKTPYYCNDPIAELEYLFSGRAKFGPHHYKLHVIPMNRQHCLSEEEVIILTPIPADLNDKSILVIHGDNNSYYNLEINKIENK